MTRRAEVYDRGFEPVTLKRMMKECDIRQADLAVAVAEALGRGVSRALMNLGINRGYEPPTVPGFRKAVEEVLASNPRAQQWLLSRELTPAAIWEPLGCDMRLAMPAGHGRRSHNRRPAITAGDPEQIIMDWEVEMISQEALRHFKIFRNPFVDDVQKDADIFMSDEHRYIEAAMLDAARHGGFLAVIGEVGSGKSIMRKKVIQQLKRDGDVLIIYPQTYEKTQLTTRDICEAIVMDLTSESPKRSREALARQVHRILLDRAKQGFRNALFIEESQDFSINMRMLKSIKRLYEIEDGYQKLLGIVIIGQSELKHLFNEGQNIDLREVIRRVQVAEIRGLNGHLQEYLALKFKRIGRDPGEIFAEDAYAALSQRLTSKSRDGHGTVSHAYPLLVNNYVVRAMNLAEQMGETRITADVVMAI